MNIKIQNYKPSLYNLQLQQQSKGNNTRLQSKKDHTLKLGILSSLLFISSPLSANPSAIKTIKNNAQNPPFAMAVARKESSFDQTAKGPKGGVGLMQVLPATAKEKCPDKNIYKSPDNVKCGEIVLEHYFTRVWNMLSYRGLSVTQKGEIHTKLSLMAYNWGPGKVKSKIKLAKKHFDAQGINPTEKQLFDYIISTIKSGKIKAYPRLIWKWYQEYKSK